MKLEVGQIYQVDGPNCISLAKVTNVHKHIIHRFINRFKYIKKYNTKFYKTVSKS